MEVCDGCGLQSVAYDMNVGVLACEGCGLVRQETEYRHAEYDEEGTKRGCYVGGRGTASSFGGRAPWRLAPGSSFSNRTDHKRRYTVAKLDELGALLRLPKDKVEEVRHMIGIITEEKWGASRWMDILIGTCVYIIARQLRLPLSAAEIATPLSCSVKELLRVYHRVCSFLEISSNPFDPAVYFDKVMSHYPAFMAMERDVARRLSKQGHCLLSYGTEWCLSAGRHPLGLVAAVAVLVGKANNIKVDIEVVSRDLHVHPATARLRLNEFIDALVGFGQRLPWGKDITLKTVGKHLPFLLQYLEARMKVDSNQAVERSAMPMTPETLSSEDVTLRRFAKVLCDKYGPQIRAALDGQLVDVAKEGSDPEPVDDATGIEEITACTERNEANGDATGIEESTACMEKEEANGDAFPNDSSGGSCKRIESSSKGSVEGLIAQEEVKPGSSTTAERHRVWTPLPPSFLANLAADARRAARIRAAKKRIASVKQDMAKQLGGKRKREDNGESPPISIDSSVSRTTHAMDKGLDDEDFLIQYCLIRGADEKILQAGYYRLALSTPPIQPDKEIMTDSELLQYFRTPEEIEFLESLSSGESPYPWLTKEDLE